MIGVARLMGASALSLTVSVRRSVKRQGLVRFEVEEIESDAGDVGDQQVDRVEHGEDVALHEHLVLLRRVGDGFVRLIDECEDARVRLGHGGDAEKLRPVGEVYR